MRYEYRYRRTVVPPVGLATLSSILYKDGFEVGQDDLEVKMHYVNSKLKEKINYAYSALNDKDRVNSYLNGNNDSTMEKISENFLKMTDIKDFDIIGFSILYVGALFPALLMAKKIKEKTNATVVFGGNNYMAEEDFNNFDFVDYIINTSNPFEFSAILDKIGKGHYNVRQIISSQNNDFMLENLETPMFKGLPLDTYPSLVPQGTGGIFKEAGESVVLPYFLWQGCNSGCLFCGRAREKPKLKTINKISDELSRLSNTYKTNCFYFLNNEFNIGGKPVNEFLNGVINKKIKIKWADSARLDISSEQLLKMRKAGCVEVCWGLESGSCSLLEKHNKKISIEQAENTLRMAKMYGIFNVVNLILGLPFERYEDFKETLEFLRRNYDCIDGISAGPFFPDKGSSLYLFPEKFGLELKNVNTIELFNYYCLEGAEFLKEKQGMSLQQYVELLKHEKEALQKMFFDNMRYDPVRNLYIKK